MTQSLTQETEQRTTQTQRSKFSPALKRRFLQGMVERVFYCSLLYWPERSFFHREPDIAQAEYETET